MTDLPLADGFLATPERFLWHERTGTAVLSDLHLGAEAEMSRAGMMMPDVSSEGIRKAWGHLCQRLAAVKGDSRLIIAGDLFHASAPAAASIAAAVELLQVLPKKCRATIVPGNHDPVADDLRRMFANARVTIQNATSVGGYTIIHGHQSADAVGAEAGEWQAEAGGGVRWVPRGLIVGHQHPAVTLRDRVQSVKMICYATCRVRSVPLILLPAFSRAPLGSNLSERHWILDLPWPGEAQMRIAGIVEPASGPARVLDFGTLDGLRLPF